MLLAARYPVFFLTCAGSKHYADPRMNSLEAALIFAKSSKLQVGIAFSFSPDTPEVLNIECGDVFPNPERKQVIPTSLH
jgi:hypothetical protein